MPGFNQADSAPLSKVEDIIDITWYRRGEFAGGVLYRALTKQTALL